MYLSFCLPSNFLPKLWLKVFYFCPIPGNGSGYHYQIFRENIIYELLPRVCPKTPPSLPPPHSHKDTSCRLIITEVSHVSGIIWVRQSRPMLRQILINILLNVRIRFHQRVITKQTISECTL